MAHGDFWLFGHRLAHIDLRHFLRLGRREPLSEKVEELDQHVIGVHQLDFEEFKHLFLALSFDQLGEEGAAQRLGLRLLVEQAFTDGDSDLSQVRHFPFVWVGVQFLLTHPVEES
jgi:hypothetical protein